MDRSRPRGATTAWTVGQVEGELVTTCAPLSAIDPGVVQDAVMAGMAPGQDGGVIGEGDGRERCDRPVAIGRAELHQPGDVGCLARARRGRRARSGWCRRGAWRRRGAPGRGRPTTRIEHHAVLVDQPSSGVGAGAARGIPGARGWWVPRRRGDTTSSTMALCGDSGTGRDERRSRLHDAEGPVFAEVTTLVTPVVGGRVQDDEIGGRRDGRRAEPGDRGREDRS